MAFEGYINFGPTIEGEAKDKNHQKWVDMLSFHFGVSQSITRGTGTKFLSGGGANQQDFALVKKVDKATPHLFGACADAEELKTIEVHLKQASGDLIYLKYVFSNCMISSVGLVGGASGPEDDVPREEVSVAFGKVEIEYKEHDGGTIPYGFDFMEKKRLK
jgi:type VI secretion system secreted protein Hcp